VRRLLALALVLSAVLVALPTGTAGASDSTAAAPAGAKVTPAPNGRFAGRCMKGTKDINNCPDVLYGIGGNKYTLYFQLDKTYCSAMEKETPGVWSYTPRATVVNGGFTTHFVYNNMTAGNHNATGAITIKFTLKGHFTTAKTLSVVISGKVTHAVSPATDCAKVKFNEVHLLKLVNF
jgi:hypothetical protein